MMLCEQSIDPFSATAVTCFRKRVTALIENDLNLEASCAEDFTDRFLNTVNNDRDSLQRIHADLKFSEIRSRWNVVLREKRSAFISEWLAPHVVGNLLDLLCGEGGVGEYMTRYDVDVTLTERSGAYSHDRRRHQAPYFPFETFTQTDTLPRFDTVLLCTVLHHESDPEALLSLAASMARLRMIILENCLEPDCPSSYQLLVDIFFNECLNKIGIGYPASHKTIEDWVSLVSRFGEVKLVEHRSMVPGIPLSHNLIVVDL